MEHITREAIDPNNNESPIFALYNRIETLEGCLRAYLTFVPALIASLPADTQARIADVWAVTHADALAAFDSARGQYIRPLKTLMHNQRNGYIGEFNRLQEAIAYLTDQAPRG